MVLDGHLQQEANLEEDAEEIRPKGKYIHKTAPAYNAGAVFLQKSLSQTISKPYTAFLHCRI